MLKVTWFKQKTNERHNIKTIAKHDYLLSRKQKRS